MCGQTISAPEYARQNRPLTAAPAVQAPPARPQYPPPAARESAPAPREEFVLPDPAKSKSPSSRNALGGFGNPVLPSSKGTPPPAPDVNPPKSAPQVPSREPIPGVQWPSQKSGKQATVPPLAQTGPQMQAWGEGAKAPKPRTFPIAVPAIILVTLGGFAIFAHQLGLFSPVEAAPVTAAPPAPVVPAPSIPALPGGESPVDSVPPGPAPLASVNPAPAPVPAPTPAPAPVEAAAPADVVTASIEANPPFPPVQDGLRPVNGTIETPSMSPETAKAEGTPVEEAPPGVPENAMPNGILGPPRKAVQDFFQADNWQKRAKFVYNGDALQSKMAAYYKDQPDVGILNYRLDFFHTEQHEPTGYGVFVFFVTFEGEPDGFPMIVVEKNNEYKVDWELFTEFKDRAFKQFVETKPTAAEPFRLVLQRVNYWESDRDQIPNIDSYLCFQVDPPYPGFRVHAFVAKDSEIGKSLAGRLLWQTDPLAAEVVMRWAKFENGRAYPTIDRVVSETWVRP